LAEERGLPAEAIADLWEKLVEASIAYEGGHWDSLKGG
jgi:isochorismate pyruvate lyase